MTHVKKNYQKTMIFLEKETIVKMDLGEFVGNVNHYGVKTSKNRGRSRHTIMN